MKLPMRSVVCPMKFFAYLTVFLFASLPGMPASEVQGDIRLDSRITKSRVPPAVYDLRGMAPHEKRQKSGNVSKFGHIAVWLEGESISAAPISATMRQSDLHFDPDFLIVPTGSKVLFPNFDPLFHNIFSLSPTQPFDLGYYEKGKSREIVFSRSGIVQIYCHVHPEMYGVVVITPSSFAARPSEDGTFAFTGIAQGKYKCFVWQRSTGLVHKSISVPSNGAVRVSFTLPMDDEGQ
jgi:plastocyanin